MDKNIINSLLIIANKINFLYEVLIDLSKKDLEDTKLYRDNIKELRKYYLLEDKIVSKLDTQEINDILSRIDKNLMDEDTSYERLFITLCSRLDYLEDIKQESSEILNECFSNLDDDEFIDEEIIDEDGEIIDYDIDENNNDCFHHEVYDHELDKFRDYELSRIYLLALKDMEKLLIKNNDNESINLLEDLKIFKYDIFRMTKYLEEFAINYYFDINSIPNFNDVDGYDFSPIYYNRAFTIIYELNDYSVYDNNVGILSEVVFLLILFELLISKLDKDRLNKLKKLCFKISNDNVENTYLSECLKKIYTKE